MNINVGCIILTNTINLEKYGMTWRTIQSLISSESNIFFDIKVIESNKDALRKKFIYDTNTEKYKIQTITPNEEFGYNKFLNYGLNEFNKYILPKWIIVSNNDLIFTQNWLTKLLDFQKNNSDVLSLSPWEPNWHTNIGKLNPLNGPYYGYRPSIEITGWCLLIHNSVIRKCKLFDPNFIFWYQDDDYGMTLKYSNVKHALIPESKVYHIENSSHDTVKKNKLNNMTYEQIKVFKDKWKEQLNKELI